ncbi:MAG: hypothetical protein ACOC44_18435 [Promethearchaeia archaeon]
MVEEGLRPDTPPAEQTETISRQQADGQTTRWQLSGADLMEQLKQRLKGKMWDEREGKYKKVGKELVNDEGVGSILSIVNFYINKNTQLSYFIPKEISMIMENFRKDLTDLFKLRHSDFDLDKEDMSLVHGCVSNFVWAALNRARYGGEKEFLQNSEQRVIRHSGQEEKQGFLSKINPFS